MKGRQMALCGLLTALAVLLLLLGGLIPAATFCAPMLAMAALLPVLEEYGPRLAWAAYAAAALLALLLAGDREMALVYLFFGWYPILRPRVAALRSRALRLVCRLAVCNGAIAVLYGLTLSLLGLGETAVSSWAAAGMLVMGNATFLAMDAVLSRLTVLWRVRLRRRLFRN